MVSRPGSCVTILRWEPAPVCAVEYIKAILRAKPVQEGLFVRGSLRDMLCGGPLGTSPSPPSGKFSKALVKKGWLGYAAFWIWTSENSSSGHLGE